MNGADAVWVVAAGSGKLGDNIVIFHKRGADKEW